MGLLDWFRRRTPQEKTVVELARDRNFVEKIEDAFNSMLDFKNRISSFLDDLEKSAKNRKNYLLRNAIERHGFLISPFEKAESWDVEKVAVYSNR